MTEPARDAVARVRIQRDGAERVLDVAAGPFAIADHVVLHLGAIWEVEARAAIEVDAAPVAPGARAPLRPGARIVVAGWTIVVEDAPPGAPAAGALRTASVARELVRDLLGGDAAGAAPGLTIEAGPSSGQHIPLPPPPSRLVLGRGEDADIVVLDPDLSRHHLAFERDHEGVRVVDLGSKNGTRRNGDPVTSELLHAGDTITCGATRLVFHDPAADFLRALDPAPAPIPLPPPPPIPSPLPPPPPLLPILIAATIAALAIVALILLLV